MEKLNPTLVVNHLALVIADQCVVMVMAIVVIAATGTARIAQTVVIVTAEIVQFAQTAVIATVETVVIAQTVEIGATGSMVIGAGGQVEMVQIGTGVVGADTIGAQVSPSTLMTDIIMANAIG